MGNSNEEPDTVLVIKFLARCMLAIGIPSFAWALYLWMFYSVNFNAIMSRLAFTFAMVAVGFILLFVLGTKNRDPSRLHGASQFIGGRLDGLMFFLSIPAIIGMLFILLPVFGSFWSSDSDNSQFESVKVKVDSIEIKHVPEENVSEEKILDAFYLPSKYMDLWLACGKATLLEVNGVSIEPSLCQATFSFPKIERRGRRSNFICHYKMDAEMDSERYRVGEVYSGWRLRENPEAGVIFIRPVDKSRKEVAILVTLFVATCLYLTIRIAIGRRLQDPHWIAFVNIWTK